GPEDPEVVLDELRPLLLDAVARALTECGVTVVTNLDSPVDGVVSLVGDVEVDVPLWTIVRGPVDRGLSHGVDVRALNSGTEVVSGRV
ncbi:hypothetical protein ACFQ1S_44425, partial [Kibdelosporangium lantanae]